MFLNFIFKKGSCIELKMLTRVWKTSCQVIIILLFMMTYGQEGKLFLTINFFKKSSALLGTQTHKKSLGETTSVITIRYKVLWTWTVLVKHNKTLAVYPSFFVWWSLAKWRLTVKTSCKNMLYHFKPLLLKNKLLYTHTRQRSKDSNEFV